MGKQPPDLLLVAQSAQLCNVVLMFIKNISIALILLSMFVDADVFMGQCPGNLM